MTAPVGVYTRANACEPAENISVEFLLNNKKSPAGQGGMEFPILLRFQQ